MGNPCALVITDGQQAGRWRLLHNHFGPEQRCSVGSSLRCQPTPSTSEQHSAQDYTFEALHRVYFYDAWRAQPILDTPGSELSAEPGLLVHGCCWPQPSATPDVLSDHATEEEERGAQAEQPLSAPAATDATMADEEASEAVSVRAPTTWYMPHEIAGVFHMLLRHGRGFGLSDLEETANAVGHRPLGSNWFRPEKVKATSSFACQLQPTHKDLSRVDLDLPEGLLVGLGYAATSPDSPLDFRQAQNAAERSGVASPHRWSLMLPTSARVAQEVYEPLIGIQYPMLCSRMGDTWQIGTTSIREDHRIASGLRFVHWCHASPNVHARHNPKNDPTV